MPRAAATAFAGILVLATLLTACDAGGKPTPSDPGAASPVVGVIVDVEATGLDKVSGFTLLAGGRQIHFTLGALENPTEFPPGHLKEHQATASPVRVFFRDGNVAYRLEDAAP